MADYVKDKDWTFDWELSRDVSMEEVIGNIWSELHRLRKMVDEHQLDVYQLRGQLNIMERERDQGKRS